MVLLARGLLPDLFIEGREEGVALEGPCNAGDDEAIHQRQGFGIDLGAADDEGRGSARQRGGLGQRAGCFHPGVLPLGIAGDDDVAAVGQRPADRFEGLAAHQDGMPRGGAFEVGQVFRQMPGQGVADADAVVEVGGDDDGELAGRSAHAGAVLCLEQV